MKGPTSLFSRMASDSKLHPNFKALRDAQHCDPARSLMDNLFAQLGSPRRFAQDFQSGGFHGRVFELGCYAYLKASGLSVDYRLDSPDFIVSHDGVAAAIEATVASPSDNQLEDISIERLEPRSDEEIFDRVSNDFPIRMARVLEKKLRHRYWEQPQCAGKPLVIAVAPFFEPGSVTYTDDALLGYLYGFADQHQYDGRNAPSGFFLRPDVRHVSAVLFANQFTVPRFYRLGADSSVNRRLVATRQGYYYRRGAGTEIECGEYRYQLGNPAAPDEPWWQGVTLFLNPLAAIPLPDQFLRCSSMVRVDYDGNVVREVFGFHTLTSFMIVYPAGTEQTVVSQPSSEK
jgi:hypothetical protein